MRDKLVIIILLLYLLLLITLQNPLFDNSQSNSNPITIVGDIGPTTYENGTLKIQYIGYPFLRFF